MNPHLADLNLNERLIAEEAVNYVKTHRREIIDRFAGASYASTNRPISLFMAGSPGAGKTEVSKYLLKELGIECLRLDADEIRYCFPAYTGSNSKLFQSAVSIAIEKLHDYVIKTSKSFILDGTFSHYEVARKNILRSIKKDRSIVIIYVYQEPLTAWRFTQQREAKEGRNIPKSSFIEQFIGAKETVQKIKDEFGDNVNLWLIKRDLKQDQKLDITLNIEEIDSFIGTTYSKEALEDLIV